jgi:hypothetical protein
MTSGNVGGRFACASGFRKREQRNGGVDQVQRFYGIDLAAGLQGFRSTIGRAFQGAWKITKRFGLSSNRRRNTSSRRASDLEFVAYATAVDRPQIKVASARRKWMDDTRFHFANRCLPLLMANQAGWFILNDRTIDVTWNGGDKLSDLTIRYYKRNRSEIITSEQVLAISHFGSGILTWRIPFLFRTPPGYNLYVRGPSNWCKDGACPLDGIVETDWAPATFTMNWKITRTGIAVPFEQNEPICMLFPLRRSDFGQFQPELRYLRDEPTLAQEYRMWAESRVAFNRALEESGAKPSWEKHYFLGRSPNGRAFSSHQLGLKLRDFCDSTHRDRL